MQIWEGISEFVAVAELGSFTAAAKRLDISTAQVSRQITALEERHATRLFYRTTRKVSLTDIGRVYYQHCRQVMDGLDEANRALTELQNSPKGRLKLTAPITYGENMIAPLLHRFIQQYPALDVELTLSNAQLDLVSEGYDLAIRLGKLDDSSLMAKRLGSRVWHVCASPGYLEAFGTPHTISELDSHNCLTGISHYWSFLQDGRKQHHKVSGNLHCNSGRALTDAALRGLGLVQLPDYYVKSYIDSGELVEVLENSRHADDGIWAVYPQNRHLSSKVRMLVDFFAAEIH